MRLCRALSAFVAVSLLGSSPALAFDTGPHTDITRDAMYAEGFGRTAADVAVVNNWFVDLYSNASAVPHSGHAKTINEILAFSYGHREHWSQEVIDAAVDSHFDSHFDSFATTAGLEREWARLRRAVARQARLTRQRDDPRALLSVIGMSLHEVQDFYAHTNWVDGLGSPGADGPDWPALAFGHTPTWFDLTEPERAGLSTYAGGTPGHGRVHGGWNSDGNRSVLTAINKDWPGRPGYDNAHITAYFATRQWLRAIRAQIGDDAFWQRAQRWSDRAGAALDHDLWGATWIGMHSGHWQGQGEPCNPQWSWNVCGDRNGPGGNLLELRAANKRYFESWPRSSFRRQFEREVPALAQDAAGEPLAVAGSRELQRSTRFVRVRVMSYRAGGLSDAGPDDADLYTRATIDGQRFQSGTINGHDNYRFPRPNAPFEWLKAVSAGATRPQAVTSMQVEIRTSSARFAGTDDNVYLRINPRQRFRLDKRLYDDFERGDRDTYSVPIDGAVRDGLRVSDITAVRIEKSRDGIGGAWKLRGVRLIVNGRRVYSRDGIERWLEGDHRSWRAPDFRRRSPSTAAVPVTFDAYDDDYGLYGGDDHGDVDRFGMRRTHAVLYTPGTVLERVADGGNVLGGRLGDGQEATLRYRIETITPVAAPIIPAPVTPPIAPPVAGPGPSPPSLPDLVITANGWDPDAGQYFLTVANHGTATAGPFAVAVVSDGGGSLGTYSVARLAPGESLTIHYGGGCYNATLTATADAGGEVAELNEDNNSREHVATCIL